MCTQNSRNWALFTHKIFHVTDKARSHGRSSLHQRAQEIRREFGNDNMASQHGPKPVPPTFLAQARQPGPVSLAGASLDLGCRCNSTAELNGRMSINDKRKVTHKFTGPACFLQGERRLCCSYASYSRCCKAGAFNLDLLGP